MPHDGPDGAEGGGNATATANYNRLINLNFSTEEQRLSNFLRALYRASHAQGDLTQMPFVVGGALVYNGANIRISGDDGVYYSLWRHNPGLRTAPRTGPLSGSSHQSDVEQYEIYLEGAGVFLVGISHNFGGIAGPHTWFQSEKHAAMGSWGQNIMHGLTYFQHAASGWQQVGAFGTSPYSEKSNNALVVLRGNYPAY